MQNGHAGIARAAIPRGPCRPAFGMKAVGIPVQKLLPGMAWYASAKDCTGDGRRINCLEPAGQATRPRNVNDPPTCGKPRAGWSIRASVASFAPRERILVKGRRGLPGAATSSGRQEVTNANRGVECSAPPPPAEQLSHRSGRARDGCGHRRRARPSGERSKKE